MKMEEYTAKKDGTPALEIGLADRSIWILKCPSLVASSLQYFPFPDESYRPVAKVALAIDPLATEDEETKFVMELARAESGNIPKRYALDMSKDFIPMCAFSDTSDGNEISPVPYASVATVGSFGRRTTAEGKIKNKFDMRPHNESIESYGQLCRERASKYMCKNRQIQVIGNASGMHLRPMQPMIIPTANPDKKKLTNKTSDMKRTRRDRREMEEVMFNLFERQSNWTLRLLIQETDQPEQFLKDLLRDLCIYNNKGSNQGTYELKPEYKKATQE
ncbi:unnamed protein product [Thlaspi arvense]|uniref:TFIIF beta subunit HTH domain-containing protein n=1 Tax=Thlaspi arvense TaxID=13288 RepID=A0AAU9SE21_THLAR|nr:unnamed protein product [Thlaspi arvense]